MAGILPFMRGHQMLRTWVALSGASVATFFVHDPVGFVAIDAIAAAVVVARPSGIAQKAIGVMFALMMVFDLVYALTPQKNYDLFLWSLTVVGWVQWAILAGWTGYDLWGRYFRWSDPAYGSPHPVKRRVR